MLRGATGLLLATMLCAAFAREPAVFEPGKLKGPAGRTPNEVMVLGTAHLRHLPATSGLQPASLADRDPKGYGEALARAWDNPASARRRQQDKELQARLGDAGRVLALYRAINDRSQAGLIYASDFGAALEESSRGQFGRGYVGWWETRNLRMASNIREAIANQPGSRTLVIVGASHKWYLEAYLGQMHDVRIVPTDAVLR